jgi:polygalacturonase
MTKHIAFICIALLLITGCTTNQSQTGAPTNSSDYSILNYGAVPDGKTLSTSAIQQAVDACEAAGGGRVLVPTGTFLTGAIFLKSNIDFHVSSGAIMLGSENFDDYPPIDGIWEGIQRTVYSSMLTGHDLKNVTISGSGTLDGQGEVWWDAHFKTNEMRKELGLEGREPDNPEGAPLTWPRPRIINLYRCTGVVIRDLTILDSPAWTVHTVYCQNVLVDNISIIQPYESPNTDGINPESCKDVRIVNCFVDCGDDCITIKSGYNEHGRKVGIPCENIVVANCTFSHGRSAIGIGSETSGDVRNVVVSNCVFKDTYRGLRIKTGRGRGGVVENIRATNIVMQNVGTGISLDMFYGGKDESPMPVTEETPFFRNIRYSHITGTGIKLAGEVLGLPKAPMEGVSFTDVHLNAEEGLRVQFVKNLAFRDVEINVPEGSALSFRKGSEIVLDEVTSRAPVANTPVIRFEQIENAVVRNCRAVDNTDIFLELKGADNADIEMINNILIRASKNVNFTDGARQQAITTR